MSYVRLIDIANKLGVTVNTVSRALNGKPGVSESTRVMIKQVAEDMGYQPNVMARCLRGYSSNIIGVILLNCSNPFLAGVLKSIDETADSLGYNILMFNIDRNNEKIVEAIKVLSGIRARGIIMQPLVMTDNIKIEIENSHLPFVIYGYGINDLKADIVRSNDEQGGYLMMQYLISRGYNEVTFIESKYHHQPFKNRFMGVKRAATEAGWSETQLKVIEMDLVEKTYYNMIDIIKSGNVPRCIFCANDFMAIETLAALRDCEIIIPGEVAVAGYDGTPGRHSCYMPLTTMFSDYAGIGKNGVELLHKRIMGKTGNGYKEIVIDPKLEEGATT